MAQDSALPVDQGNAPEPDSTTRRPRPREPSRTEPLVAQPTPGQPIAQPTPVVPGPGAQVQPTGAAAATPPAGTGPRARGEPPFGFVPGPPPPILVVPIADARVNATTVQAISDAVAAALAPISRGRPIQPVGDAARLAAVAACREPTCLGAQIAEAGGVAGVIVRVSRRAPRGPIDVTLGVADPVSGAPRGEPVTGQIPAAAEASPGANVTPLVAQLVDAMPSPPPPPATLLVTVNVDNAMVRIDNHEAGRSPLAPLTIRPGRYPVLVTADGHHLTRQMATIGEGEQARLDVTLEPDQAAQAMLTEQQERDSGGGDDGPIYTKWWFLAAGGVVVLAATIAIIVVATSGGGPNNPAGFPVPGVMR